MKWGAFENKGPLAKCIGVFRNDEIAIDYAQIMKPEYPDAIVKQVNPGQKVGEIAK